MPVPHAACGGLWGPVCGAGMLEAAPLLHADRKLSARLRFNIAKVLAPNHRTIPRNVKSGPFIVGLDRPRSSDCLNRSRELCPSRTAAPWHAACWEGRARRDAFRCTSLSLVGIRCCRLVPPDLCGFPDGSPQRDEGKICSFLILISSACAVFTRSSNSTYREFSADEFGGAISIRSLTGSGRTRPDMSGLVRLCVSSISCTCRSIEVGSMRYAFVKLSVCVSTQRSFPCWQNRRTLRGFLGCPSCAYRSDASSTVSVNCLSGSGRSWPDKAGRGWSLSAWGSMESA
jgi:hypothetical protein